ncbi:Mur ligase domain-containing protein, partial [Pseudactinotalea suaedae]
MQLRDLSDAVGAAPGGRPADLDVSAVTHNTSWVTPGAAYVAIRGARVDGHDFVDAAIAAGAVVVIGEGAPDGVTYPVPYLTVVSARAALADAAAAIAGNPSRALRVVGVTGTDGKTTTSWLTRHLLRAAGLATGLLSTVGYELADGEL